MRQLCKAGADEEHGKVSRGYCITDFHFEIGVTTNFIIFFRGGQAMKTVRLVNTNYRPDLILKALEDMKKAVAATTTR